MAATRSPLVTVAELRAMTEVPTLLDVRWRLGGPSGLAEFRHGHVPGARFVSLDTELADPPGERGRHPLPDPVRLQEAMRRAGVGRSRPVVVYDDSGGTAAARAWWLLRHHGHPDVRVLDGGWSAWVAEGGPVAIGDPAPAEGDFTVAPGRMPVVEADELAGLVERGVLVDARAPERYRGETEPVDPVAGHIPGAVNVPTSANLTEDGRFRTAQELRALYAAVGAAPGTPVAAYCGSGVTAAHDVLAMAVAGIESALYPGSWSEWIVDRSRPVVTSGRP